MYTSHTNDVIEDTDAAGRTGRTALARRHARHTLPWREPLCGGAGAGAGPDAMGRRGPARHAHRRLCREWQTQFRQHLAAADAPESSPHPLDPDDTPLGKSVRERLEQLRREEAAAAVSAAASNGAPSHTAAGVAAAAAIARGLLPDAEVVPDTDDRVAAAALAYASLSLSPAASAMPAGTPNTSLRRLRVAGPPPPPSWQPTAWDLRRQGACAPAPRPTRFGHGWEHCADSWLGRTYLLYGASIMRSVSGDARRPGSTGQPGRGTDTAGAGGDAARPAPAGPAGTGQGLAHVPAGRREGGRSSLCRARQAPN